ncbi:MAG: YlmC/YmxH family sporulation protein [Clostridia bacterium]|nr:YlmC/YmxH family sporulation protein [Clostridia bacterium]MBQ3553232.1 YlmC/YmxH family sporulation protein [Clostridia bacterium]
MYRAGEFRQKEVINISDASRLGFVSDVEVSLEKGEIEAIIVPGKTRLFNFGKSGDYTITWDKIRKIGDDLILVEIPSILLNE